MPSPTVPNYLTKEQLLETVIDSITGTGSNVLIRSTSLKTLPLEIIITDGATKERVLVYIWNISQGGKTRSRSEYRIQLKGKSLTLGEDFKTLLLGWYDEKKIFVAFNAYKHGTFGHSPSVQVSIGTIESAANEGVAIQTKKLDIVRGQEIVVAFQPSYIMEYINDIFPQYHSVSLMNIEKAEEEIVSNPFLDISDADLLRLSKPRRKEVITLTRNVRERKFQESIWKLYQGKCAICGLQVHLTDAAHIIPVGKDGSDELVNGLLLCGNHHRAYDTGLLGINEDYKILYSVSRADALRKNKEDGLLQEFLSSSRIGEEITLPIDCRFYPNKEYLKENLKLKNFCLSRLV